LRDQKIEHGLCLSDLIEEFGTLGNDTQSNLEARNDQHGISIQRFYPNLALDEAFGIGLHIYDKLPVGSAQDSIARYDDSLMLCRSGRDHPQQLTSPQSSRVSHDRKPHWNGLSLVSKTRPLIGKIDGRSVSEDRHCFQAQSF
jgi:hypothetical protein